MRVRDDHRRDPERRHLCQRRRAGAPDDEIGRDQGREHVIAQERIRPIAAAGVSGQLLAFGQRGRVRALPGDMDDRHPLDEAWQRRRDGGIEPADRLRAAEDEDRRAIGRQVEASAGLVTGDRTDVADRRPGWVGRDAGRRQRAPGRLVRDRQRVGQPGGRPDGAARHGVALPEDDRDPHWRRCQQDRHGDVPAGGQDRRRPLGGQDGRGLRHGRRQADRVEDGVDRHVDGSQRAQGQASAADPGVANELGLEATMPADPDQVRRARTIGPVAEGARHGEGRVDVPARSARRDQQPHRSRLLVRRSRGRSTGGCRRPRG